MEALLAFAAALLAFRFAGELAARWRDRRRPELLAWSGSLLAYALASGALAWGAAAGWNEASFRLYYLFGGLLTAALLGAGSLLFAGRRWAGPLAPRRSRTTARLKRAAVRFGCFASAASKLASAFA